MKLLLELSGDPASAGPAEAAGFAGVAFSTPRYPGAGDAMMEAAFAAGRTRAVWIGTTVRLGADHPLALAEELAVLDNAAAGRVIGLVDTGQLDADAAAEDLELLRRGLQPQPITFEGTRHRVPARLPGQTVTTAISVQPQPAQPALQLWMLDTGDVARRVADGAGLAVLGGAPQGDAVGRARPVWVDATTAEDTRAAAQELRDRGATHAVVRLRGDLAGFLERASRDLIAPLAMRDYPELMSRAKPPVAWRAAAGVSGP